VRRSKKARLYASFFIVYFVWGSSFLAGHIGVEELPPLLFSAGRSLMAGAILLSIAFYRGETHAAFETRLAVHGVFCADG
jgi:drug/metabolite transporter (DMT)-like permease